jgi:glutamate racemase
MGVIGIHEKTFCLGEYLTKSKRILKKASVELGSAEAATQKSILVIDSGVGGLSICQSILAQQPKLQIIYFADSAYFPYGLLPEDELRARLTFIVGEMLALHQPKLVVLACNTVSTLVLPELRSLFDIPFVGVVPAIKPAAILSKNKRIGLLATPATIVRPYTDQLIHDYAQTCEVVKVGSSELVIEAESLLNDHSVNKKVIDDTLRPFRSTENNMGVDTIVLGCTHFPLLKSYLSESLPGINWIDSGEAVANRVTHLLAVLSVPNTLALQLEPHQLYFSKPIAHKSEFSNGLHNLGFKSFEFQYL